MHAYLKTIGFSKIKTTKELQEILRDVVENYDRKKIVETEEHHLFAEFSKEYAYDCGITVCGEIDENNRFQMEYYYPYFEGGQISSYEEVSVERHVDKESFAGACDDMRLGITMIFYLTHAAEYLEMKQKNALQPLPPAFCLWSCSGRNNSASDPERPGTGREGAPQHAAEEFTDLGCQKRG